MNSETKKIYHVLRGKSVVIGLTGSVGSGCTEAANFLSKKDDLLSILDFAKSGLMNNKHDTLEQYRIKKIKYFISDENLEDFYHLNVSDLIFCIFFSSSELYQNANYCVSSWLKNDKLEDAKNISLRAFSMINDPQSDGNLVKNLEELNDFIKKNVVKKGTGYTRAFQKIGGDLRKNGISKHMGCAVNFEEETANVFSIACFVEKTINRLKKDGISHVVVDALRNLHEINYLKSVFANFYLFSIISNKIEREKRMMGCFELKGTEIEEIQKFESNKESNYSQNINSCIINGDVFITNNNDKREFFYNLLKYLCLIKKPGLFTPTKDERNMQIALTARYNSGCISRQVGACVTGKDGYILGVGWNDVQEGSIPCLYRSSYSLLIENNNEPEFSKYETESDFRNYLRDNHGINKKPFCFKDIENGRQAVKTLSQFQKSQNIDLNESQQKELIGKFKNPTRERALHAEENAFLQSAKVGGSSLKDGTLYTTASPCQLCAKKAMQLGISRIVYIDAYPDISTKQTLESGDVNNRPSVEQFTGAAESAFMRLFKPLMNIKDEFDTDYHMINF